MMHFTSFLQSAHKRYICAKEHQTFYLVMLMLYCVKSNYTVSCCVVLYHFVQHYVVWCYIILCYIVTYCITSHHTTCCYGLWHIFQHVIILCKRWSWLLLYCAEYNVWDVSSGWPDEVWQAQHQQQLDEPKRNVSRLAQIVAGQQWGAKAWLCKLFLCAKLLC